MIGTHAIPDHVFAQLSATYGGTEGIEILRRARHSALTLLLMNVLTDHARPSEVVDLLIHMDRTEPAGTAELLLYPWIGPWLAGALLRPWSAADEGYLTGVAIAGAIRAGQAVPRSLWIGRPAGRLEVPSIGVTGQDIDGPIADLSTAPGWLPVRPIATYTGHPTSGILLDDVDRHRVCFELPMSGRLSDAEVLRWRDRLAGAFDLLGEHDPIRYAELVAGVRAIAPLASHTAQGRSATHRYAFGGFATGLPATDEELAAIVVHEFQHSKLNALMDVVTLCEPGPERYFAPWRADPRPLGGVLHGVYSFAAMATFWDALRDVPSLEARATVQAADYRTQVLRALRGLYGAPGLTETGRRFVGGISTEMADVARPLPVDVQRRADRRLERTERRWTQRNSHHGTERQAGPHEH